MPFPRDDRGAAMVEFGLAVIPFAALVLLIFQVFLTLTQQHFLDNATQRAAHAMAMSGTVSKQNIKGWVCADGLMLYSQAGCKEELDVAIERFPPAVRTRTPFSSFVPPCPHR